MELYKTSKVLTSMLQKDAWKPKEFLIYHCFYRLKRLLGFVFPSLFKNELESPEDFINTTEFLPLRKLDH